MAHKTMCCMTLMHHFHMVTLFDLTLTLTFTQFKTLTYGTFFIPWGGGFWQSLGSQLLLVPSWQQTRRKMTTLTFGLSLT